MNIQKCAIVEVRGVSSNRNPGRGPAIVRRPIGGVNEANGREINEMVELEEDSSNQIFDVLEDWEHVLTHENIDFEELGL